ncbi:hypothetical protein NK718_13400 [Alsobacter sp. SYSU M60028]|uniref:Uncharacterized protein n=1 Tax=Alsobacter ponti TaxID=2962936 RepID=A0ABT1LEY5_9HYPH|nr:hypothetical protein [Alsobacter ponti]MCP8939516.1 hypothetical protein [Alsobacter ponti]
MVSITHNNPIKLNNFQPVGPAADPSGKTGAGPSVTTDDTPPLSDSGAATGANQELPSDPGAVAGKVKQALQLLTDGAGKLDIAALAVMLAASQRRNALDDRMNARQMAQSSLQSEAGKIEEAAQKELTAAIVSLVTSVVSAVASIMGTVGSIKAGVTTGGGAGEAVTRPMTSAEKLAQLGQLVKDVTEKAGKAQEGITSSVAKMDEAQAKRMAANAQAHEGRAERAKEIEQALEDFMKAIVNFLKEMADAKTELMQSLTRA